MSARTSSGVPMFPALTAEQINNKAKLHDACEADRARKRIEAAAPDLLAVLKAIESALDGDRNRYGKLEHYTVRDSEPLRLLAVHYKTPGARDVIEQAVQVARAAIAKATGAV